MKKVIIIGDSFEGLTEIIASLRESIEVLETETRTITHDIRRLGDELIKHVSLERYFKEHQPIPKALFYPKNVILKNKQFTGTMFHPSKYNPIMHQKA